MGWRPSGWRWFAVAAAVATGASFGAPPPEAPALARAAAVAASALSAGGRHTCALLADGSVACWGDNVDGQLGIGTSAGPSRCHRDPCAATPVPVHGIGTATAISAGDDHTCALLVDGSVECWGANGYGQLGLGTSRGPQRCSGEPCATTPVAVRGIVHAMAIVAGGSHTCALVRGGSVECWGANGYGQLGAGTSGGPERCTGEPCSTMPRAVHGIATAAAIAAGNDHTCALLAVGTVDCWGYNFSAELGVGTSSGPHFCTGGQWCSTTAVAVLGLANATAITAGGDHTCALVPGGRVACWGYNSYGQLGDGVSNGPETCEFGVVRCAKTPVPASGIASAVTIAAGGDHTCALVATGAIACWGADASGELGDGTHSGPSACNGYPCSTTAVTVLGIAGANAVTAGYDHTCALLAGGAVVCWGNGAHAQLGDGGTRERDRPVAVRGLG